MMASSWSPQNATRAYLQAMSLGNTAKEPDVSEFISAMAAGSNARFMAIVCTATAEPTAAALVAEARETGGRVVCISPTSDDTKSTRIALGPYGDPTVEAQAQLVSEYEKADFVVVDCVDDDCRGVFEAARRGGCPIVVGYNDLRKGSWGSQVNSEILPIGEGLVIARANGRRNRWIVRVDGITCEEHIYKIRLPKTREIYS